MAVRRQLPRTARTPSAAFGQLELYQQQADLKIHKPAGPEPSVFLVYPLLTNTSRFYIALGKLMLCKSLVHAIMVFSDDVTWARVIAGDRKGASVPRRGRKTCPIWLE